MKSAAVKCLLIGAVALGYVFRRLHLVRPDLIPYPVSVQIYC